MKLVEISPTVELYLEDLVRILYDKHYFSFPQYSKRYVDTLIDNIKNDLPFKSHRRAPSYFDRYDDNLEYASFKKNRRTTWYVFFNVYLDEAGVETYIVKFIGNNHTLGKYLYNPYELPID